MLDVKLILEKPDYVKAALKKKLWDFDPTEIIELSSQRLELLKKVEAIKAEQNKLSASVPAVKKEGGDVKSIFAKVKELGAQNKESEERLNEIEAKIKSLVEVLPNLPDDDLVAGSKENNHPIYHFGEERKFGFTPKNHVELCESLGLIDYKRAAKISGTGTWIYTNLGARLEWALLNYFIENHLADGYEMILPPHILNYESGYTAGQFPKFESDVFWLEGMEPRKFILPTAETALVNLHRNEILSLNDLPKKYFAYTPCYRKEAGSYRTEERGMIRGYQFNKVEMVQYTTEEGSDAAFEEMVNKAKKLVEGLGLTYQIDKLAAGDCSHSMARTYDIEVWIPSMGIYKEVSSVSNARDYQARRGMIRYKDENGKTKYCHTLNGSGLATSRVFPALVEQLQQEDGSVIIPVPLRKYMGGLEVLKPIKK
ncbi:MAG: serine--tRNA ligase [Mollicutes bacterium]|nr:serine--tRNA ligase [Mollicutes bacterium]MCI7057787.1 serine--tRNA ligase [Mollicutes bacterium]MDY3904942.1 serine--tRNA ligase [Candidatus Enteromonas sp.]